MVATEEVGAAHREVITEVGIVGGVEEVVGEAEGGVEVIEVWFATFGWGSVQVTGSGLGMRIKE